MPYTLISRDELVALVAVQLGDPTMTYWTEEELNLVVDECLFTFAAISGYWRDRVEVIATNADRIYNLLDPTQVSLGDDLLRGTKTYQDIANWLDNDLLGYSDFISSAELAQLIGLAINKFQDVTKLVLDRDIPGIGAGADLILEEDVLDIVNAWYIDSSSAIRSVLNPADEHRVSLFNNSFTIDNGKPKFYSISNLDVRTLTILPKPAENGSIDLVYVLGKAITDKLTTTCILPNNFLPYIKHKVLYDILTKSDEPDPHRAAYSLKRWQEGLTIGKNYSAIVNAKLNGVNRPLSSIQDFNNLRYNWYNSGETTINKVNAIALAGYNIVAVNTLPVNPHSLMFEVITNAPIEEVEIDVRPDYIPYLVDYCVHIASYKDGIVALQKTATNLERFMQKAVGHNMFLQRKNITHIDLLQKSKYPLKQARVEEDAA